MATIKLTPEQAAEKLYASYTYELKDGEMIATPKDEPGAEPFRTAFPQELPMRGDGNPFIPGDTECCDDSASTVFELDYVIATGRSCDDYAIYVATGNFYEKPDDGGKPIFRLRHPDISTHTMLGVQYKGVAELPELITPESELGQKLHVVAAWRVNDDPARYLCTDYIVLAHTRENFFLSSRKMMCGWIAAELSAGEVYANTYRAVRPIYRAYMEDVLLPQCESQQNDDIHYEFGEDACECVKGEGEKRHVLFHYAYTLEGAQEMACDSTKPSHGSPA